MRDETRTHELVQEKEEIGPLTWNFAADEGENVKIQQRGGQIRWARN